MTPRALSLLIALAALVVAVGTGVWLALPGPDLTSQADLTEEPVRLDLGDGDATDTTPAREPFHFVVLANGLRLPSVPSNCHADDAGTALACDDRCAADEACPPGRVCALDPDFGFRECQPLRRFCDTDADCDDPTQTCHPVGASASGRPLGRCTERGDLPAGAHCTGLSPEPEDTCAPGLRCLRERCGPPCDLHDPDACAPGSECAPNPYRARGVCVPTCRDRPCPQGERCAQDFSGDVPVCQPFVGPDCLGPSPCSARQDCLRGFAEPTLETEAFECRARCDDQHPCAPGRSCDAKSGYCFQPCEQDRDCAAPERCHALHRQDAQRGCGLIAEGLPNFRRP